MHSGGHIEIARVLRKQETWAEKLVWNPLPRWLGSGTRVPARVSARLGFSTYLVAVIYGLFISSFAAEWHQGHGYRWQDLALPASGKTGFALLPPERTGIRFTNYLSDEHAAANRILENGSGVALGDIDGDGRCDIYFCRLDGPNVLYRNLGDWKFEDITASAGVACAGQFSTGAVFADVDGDGDLDLLVTSIGGGTRCFLNDGKGHFQEVLRSGLVQALGATSMALADIDGDGALDLYVANYRTTTFKDSPPGLQVEAKMVNGTLVVTPEDRFRGILTKTGAGVMVVEKGEPDFLYVNKGGGRFGRISWTGGAFLDESGAPLNAPPLGWGLSVMFRDINQDGLPDIYVCNDFFLSPDQIWMNDQGRRFRALRPLAMRNMSMSSMSVDFADIDRDGHDDFFVADMLSRKHSFRQRQRPNMLKGLMDYPITDPMFRPESPRNTLQVNRGDGTHAEIAQMSGLAASEWSWSAIFLDVDLDGFEDLLITNGNDHDVLDADTLKEVAAAGDRPANATKSLLKFPRLRTPNLAFRNRGDLTFEEMGPRWGFDTPGISQGMALADLDNDGDLDVVVNNLNGPAALYRNESIAPRIAVRLKGAPPNTHGIGAKIVVYGGAVPRQSQEMICGGRYLSCDDTVRVFAAGAPTNVMRIEITWRSGKRSIVPAAKSNRIYEMDEMAAQPVPPGDSLRANVSPPHSVWFDDVRSRISHRHVDEPFDDFSRQPLLSKQLSQLGPGVCWLDWNGDGWDDLIIGTGKGGESGLYLNDGHGGFKKQSLGNERETALRDEAGLAGFHNGRGAQLIRALANYEDGAASGLGLRMIHSAGERTEIPARSWSSGPIALADMEGNGQLALFWGGRVIPARYPEPASSLLLRQKNGRWEVDENASAAFRQVGMVSGAVWSDLNGDGFPELILACDWGPIRIFENQRGALQETTRSWGLHKFNGWWNGIAAGDFDGDGRMDLVASNWGRNTRYEIFRGKPLRAYYGDLAGDGSVQLLEAYHDPDFGAMVPWVDFGALSQTLPFVLEKFSTYRAYSEATLDQILGNALSRARVLEANWLETTVFLNRGDHFEPKILPGEAQWAPAFGISVADFDGDGKEDIFLSQNFFDVPLDISRYDAGRGLLLRGNGNGDFTPIKGQESGIKVYGEQRGCAAADFDGDGRVDLVVAQNHGETVLYRNAGGRPGLRVRLRGPDGNRDGIGAVLRARTAQGNGPAREIHAGSGYWSQDSAVQVLAFAGPGPHQLSVRWPGGKERLYEIPAGAREVEVEWTGAVRATNVSR